MAKSKRTSGQLGCGFVFLSGIVLIGLLILNGTLVRVFFKTNLAGVDERIFQAAQFVLPIFMIVIEFWIYDQLVNRGRYPKNDE